MVRLSRLFLVLSLLREFFFGFFSFSPSTKMNISKLHLDQDRKPAWKTTTNGVFYFSNMMVYFIFTRPTKIDVESNKAHTRDSNSPHLRSSLNKTLLCFVLFSRLVVFRNLVKHWLEWLMYLLKPNL